MISFEVVLKLLGDSIFTLTRYGLIIAIKFLINDFLA